MLPSVHFVQFRDDLSQGRFGTSQIRNRLVLVPPLPFLARQRHRSAATGVNVGVKGL